MRLKYIGHLDMFPVTIGAEKYVFRPDNDYTIDVPEKDAQWMIQIAAHEFKVLPMEEVLVSSEAVEKLEETPKKRRGRPKKNA